MKGELAGSYHIRTGKGSRRVYDLSFIHLYYIAAISLNQTWLTNRILVDNSCIPTFFFFNIAMCE